MNVRVPEPSALPWYRKFFSDDYFVACERLLESFDSEREIAGVVKLLNLKPGERVLDLCCGPGRHAIELGIRGMKVTGLDLNPAYLAAARDEAARRGVVLTTVEADMRAIPPLPEFDAVINMFTSFGYLESEEEDARVLASVAQRLRAGGRLLLDGLNREWVMTNQIEREWFPQPDGSVLLEERTLNLRTSRNRVAFTRIADGKRHELGAIDVRLYTLTETENMLRRSGLTLRRVYGALDGTDYAISTRRMIVVAEK
ncbi:class I SAM-dependent methyltransferase [Pendulispora albinea]|uniref:Class I SAM-dependent methyltransferase n=1 Tax=Pendulispora albinea TaxID=2741071 RepID=A0ABZ2LW58_9BACT